MTTLMRCGSIPRCRGEGGEPSYFSGPRIPDDIDSANLPVDNVSWDDIQEFEALSGLRLPTEAQSEYACRAGTDTDFWFGNTITTDQANYRGTVPYWVPDMDNGAAGMIMLQSMLLQSDGAVIRLLPAWPKAWDVSFKLHAPRQTTVECVYRKGRIESLRVVPESRLKDVKWPDADQARPKSR